MPTLTISPKRIALVLKHDLSITELEALGVPDAGPLFWSAVREDVRRDLDCDRAGRCSGCGAVRGAPDAPCEACAW